MADGPAEQIAAEYARRVAAGQLEPTRSPYEKERVPLWKRLVALAALLGLGGAVAFMGVKYVLLGEPPDQNPPVHRSFR